MKTCRHAVIFFAIFFSIGRLCAQVGIGTVSPHAGAALEVTSPDKSKAFLPPRMTTAERDAMMNLTAGLLVFNTTTAQVNYYNGSKWVPLVQSNTESIALGALAGNTNQAGTAIAIGGSSGETEQAANAIGLGSYSGNSNQGSNAVAIGTEAGKISQGQFSIGIGYRAGYEYQEPNSIVLNATGSQLHSSSASSFSVKPVRGVSGSSSTVNYDPTSGEFTYLTSDARLKGNIVPVRDGLDKVIRLEPVAFDYRESLTDRGYAGRSVGFLAQDLRKVVPEAVSVVPGPDSLLAVNTTLVIPLLVDAARELDRRNREFEDRLRGLENDGKRRRKGRRT